MYETQKKVLQDQRASIAKILASGPQDVRPAGEIRPTGEIRAALTDLEMLVSRMESQMSSLRAALVPAVCPPWPESASCGSEKGHSAQTAVAHDIREVTGRLMAVSSSLAMLLEGTQL